MHILGSIMFQNYYYPIESYVKTLSYSGGHLGFRSTTKNFLRVILGIFLTCNHSIRWRF